MIIIEWERKDSFITDHCMHCDNNRMREREREMIVSFVNVINV